MSTPGKLFRNAVRMERPLQVVGTIQAFCALLAERAGFKALYLSGAGVANASYGLPDLGMTNLWDVLTDARRVAAATPLPLLVDIDTGFGDSAMITRTIREMERAGVAAVHIEDQVETKRCGHRPGKRLVSCRDMCDRIKAATDARTDESFVLMARTDASGVEGLESGIERAVHYVETGADMIFAEALTDLTQYKLFCKQVGVPVLANITEFGKTPLYTLTELREAGVALALYPLSAFRAMNRAAERVYQTLRSKGTQKSLIESMQTRAELYEALNYEMWEKKLDDQLNQVHGKANP